MAIVTLLPEPGADLMRLTPVLARSRDEEVWRFDAQLPESLHEASGSLRFGFEVVLVGTPEKWLGDLDSNQD